MIDIWAPIIPFKETGGIKLYSTIKDLKGILSDKSVKGVLLNNLWIRYEIKDTLYLFFNLINGKLFKITALKNYKGKLFGNIELGITDKKLLTLESSFEYDDFEEVFESRKGVYIETDPETSKIIYISVFVKELSDDSFDDGNW